MNENVLSLISSALVIVYVILHLYNNSREQKKANTEATNPEQPDGIKKEHIRALKVFGSMTVLLIVFEISTAFILKTDTGSWTRDYTTLDITLSMIASSLLTVMLNLLFTQAEKQDKPNTSHEIEG